mmetsp:Transcript_35016/g.75763  ORF Transcript_35016/g.75763 Transcript_35016/m.75763 type:complete len:224 (+) Transcript_35016:1423-2094(+)
MTRTGSTFTVSSTTQVCGCTSQAPRTEGKTLSTWSCTTTVPWASQRCRLDLTPLLWPVSPAPRSFRAMSATSCAGCLPSMAASDNEPKPRQLRVLGGKLTPPTSRLLMSPRHQRMRQSATGRTQTRRVGLWMHWKACRLSFQTLLTATWRNRPTDPSCNPTHLSFPPTCRGQGALWQPLIMSTTRHRDGSASRESCRHLLECRSDAVHRRDVSGPSHWGLESC